MKRIFLAVLLVANVLSAKAQELVIDSADVEVIQQLALRHVRQFEGLLNVLAQPDQYFKEHNHEELIQDYYGEDSDYRIFRDSLVVVEDDLYPEERTGDSSLLRLTVKNYLEAFFTLYEKSPVASVFFSGFEVSVLKQGENPYVEVFYTSEFTGRSRVYPDQAYPLRKRVAKVAAQPQSDGWKVFITELGHARLEPENANRFSELPRAYRPGKTYSLPIQINEITPPTSLILYRDTLQVEDISDVLLDSSFVWRVPKNIDRGSGYRFQLYDPLSQRTIESDPFAIKSWFSL